MQNCGCHPNHPKTYDTVSETVCISFISLSVYFRYLKLKKGFFYILIKMYSNIS